MRYITKTTSNGHDYYKIVESYCEDGQVKNRTLMNIGELPDVYALLPEYIMKGKQEQEQEQGAGAISGESSSRESIHSRDHGLSWLLYSVAQWLDVEEITKRTLGTSVIDNTSPDRSILVAALYLACNYRGNQNPEYWFYGTSLPYHITFTRNTADYWLLQLQTALITTRQIHTFESELYKRILPQLSRVQAGGGSDDINRTDYIVYIVSFDPLQFEDEEWYLHTDKQGKGITTIAVVTTSSAGIPLFTLEYKGHLKDERVWGHFEKDLKKQLAGVVPLQDITFVFDSESISDAILARIPGHFILWGAANGNGSAQLSGTPLSSREEYELSNAVRCSACKTAASLYGKTYPAVDALREDLRKDREENWEYRLLCFQNEVEHLNKCLERPRYIRDKRLETIKKSVALLMPEALHFSDFIDVSYETDMKKDPAILREFNRMRKNAQPDEDLVLETGGLRITARKDIPDVPMVKAVHYELHKDKQDIVKENVCGRTLLITDHEDWSTKRILDACAEQECIRKIFGASLRNSILLDLGDKSLTNQKLHVHEMLCYLSFFLWQTARYMLSSRFDYPIPVHTLKEHLAKIQECCLTIPTGKDEDTGKNSNKDTGINTTEYKSCKNTTQTFQILTNTEGEAGKTWEVVSSFLEYMQKNPAKEPG